MLELRRNIRARLAHIAALLMTWASLFYGTLKAQDRHESGSKTFEINDFHQASNWQLQIGDAAQTAFVFGDFGQSRHFLAGVRANNLNTFVELQARSAELGRAAGLNESRFAEEPSTGQAPPTQDRVSTLTEEKKQSEDSATSGEFVCRSIFYITDREPTGRPEPCHFYSGRFDKTDCVHFGTCQVSLPANHRIGFLESPSIWRLEFRPNRKKHVVLLNVTTCDEEQFFCDINGEVSQSEADGHALVFIHGYNVRFDDAARRTAQIAHDLKFAGPAILYSWSSKGKIHLYPNDEEAVDLTVPHLKAFLLRLHAIEEMRSIHVIAHSMGNRALTKALEALTRDTGSAFAPELNRVREVILAAPDVNIINFKRFAAVVGKNVGRMTLYTSKNDRALLLSKHFHAFPRAGEALIIVPRVDTIDASQADTSILGHGYIAGRRTVLNDISEILAASLPASKRFNLIRRDNQDGTYYLFRA